jgi:ABC-type transport system involved in cytochrome c biogenesis permease subunit
MAYRPTLEDALREILTAKGGELADYSPVERELALLSFTLNKISLAGKNNRLLRILPQDGHIRLSPWEASLQNPASKPSFPPAWEALMQAYRQEDTTAWEQALQELNQRTSALVGVSPTLLKVEYYYQQSSLLKVAMMVYIAALAIMLLGWLGITRTLPLGRLFYMGAICIHLTALVARIAILQRPPVTSLYESVLFVAFIAAIYGLWLSYKYLPRHALFVGGLVSAALLGVSDLYAEKGDTMVMPIAVLNTNFWLATHVLTITIGYGCALIAGSMAHLALWKQDRQNIFYRILPITLVLALLFTTVGTILGGIWADQSWGRFWGWDPKENGALLIVLWLSWILHGRMTQSMGAHGAAALTACTNIIVALSWFGVNLLNTGLHSYGFTERAAMGLALFCSLELLLIGLLYMRIRLQIRQS